ncbi:hypothetical protein SAMN04488126_1385, partial [Bhargavaea beijingensis]
LVGFAPELLFLGHVLDDFGPSPDGDIGFAGVSDVDVFVIGFFFDEEPEKNVQYPLSL